MDKTNRSFHKFEIKKIIATTARLIEDLVAFDERYTFNEVQFNLS